VYGELAGNTKPMNNMIYYSTQGQDPRLRRSAVPAVPAARAADLQVGHPRDEEQPRDRGPVLEYRGLEVEVVKGTT
jgi:hypothetical protein